MKWHVFAVGKPALPYCRAGVEEYGARLGKKAELHFFKRSDTVAEKWMLEKSEGMLRVALDERGEQVSSVQLASKISQWEQNNARAVALFIGGADGLGAVLKKQSQWVWSLSCLTLQHELALVVVLEQIYRAYAIKGGLPYHRA
ncbi:MAG: 23S rRNA (pseudouridine(1915)-N(3))-methyltransferase RlmH [bacterium]